MTFAELFLSQLEGEGDRTRRTLEQVPDNLDENWKPHPKSMPFGYLTTLVAGMPGWIAMIINQDQLDLNPPGGSSTPPPSLRTARELVAAADKGIADARAALQGTTEGHLQKKWQLLVAGRVVQEDVRHAVIRDTFTHLAHHRGQLTVYLRLNEAKVPALYGPSADEKTFG